MASELKPCPFCGGTDLSSGGDDKFVGYFCKTCQATGPNHYGSRDWNTRPTPAATDTGLVRYDLSMFGNGIVEMGGGAYVRADQAEELLAAKEAERAEQWRLRREMEADRDTQKAVATSLEAELAAERAEKDAYGIALMMIREGCDNPSDIASKALERFGK